MKRAEKRAEQERRARMRADDARKAAERLAIKALLDRRIPAAAHLVLAMGDPHLFEERRARGGGPTGATHSSGVVSGYATVVAWHTGADAQTVRQHLLDLIGPGRAAELGVDLPRLGTFARPASTGAASVEVVIANRAMAAIADYLISPQYLNLGGLPRNPFGDLQVANLMARLESLLRAMRLAPTHKYSVLGGPSLGELQNDMHQLLDLVVFAVSAAMPDNAVRASAVKAMRLEDCLAIYIPNVLGQIGVRDIGAHGAGSARSVPVYGAVRAPVEEPTRYRTIGDRHRLASRLLDLYGG